MIIAIVGPTGIGKTALSISLAKHYNAEIINFDAMQVYEKMDIGTAKVTKEEMDGVVHHLLSYVNVNTNYSVYDYQKEARSLIDKLLKEKKNIIMVGGTGLYLKATLYDYRFREEDNSTCYDDLSTEELLKRMSKYNYVPKDKNNKRRLVRELKKLENNIDNKEFIEENFIQFEEIFENKEKIELDDRKLRLFLNGVQLTSDKKEGIYKIYNNNKFIGIGIVENKLLKRDIVL